MRVDELISIEAPPSLQVLTCVDGKYLSTHPSSTLQDFRLTCWAGRTTTWGELVGFAKSIRCCKELEVYLCVFRGITTQDFTVEVQSNAVILRTNT